MTIEKLLAELKSQRDAADEAINIIEHLLRKRDVNSKRNAIIKAVRKHKVRKTKKIQGHKWTAAQHAKYAETMRKKFPKVEIKVESNES